MAVVAAGALALAGCTSDTADDTETPTADSAADDAADDSADDTAAAGDDAGETTGAGDDEGTASGDTAKADLGDITTNSDTVSFSSGAEEYNAYNGDTAGTNSTYNAVVNNQLSSGFWYWGTDGTVYPNEWFGSYEKTSDEPLTVEYTISDEATWSDGTPITANDYLLTWASTNPDYLFGAEAGGDDASATSAPAEGEEEAENTGEFNPVSDWSTYVTQPPEADPSGKTFTVTYDEPYPDWEIAVSGALPSHVAAEQAGLTGDELAQAILDGDGETVNGVAQFWNEGWLFPNFQVEDESLVPSSGPYTLEGASWQSGTQLTLVPNETFWGPPPATGNLMFRFAAPETHVQGLLNGDINVIDPQATVDTKQQLENAGDSIAIETGDAMTWEHLDYNFGEGSPFAEDAGGLAAREAFALCVPRQGIVDSLIKPINENAEVLNLREKFPFMPDYDEVVEAAYDGRYDEVNIEEAKAKFAEAGLEEGVEIRIGYSAPNQRRTEEVAAIKASCDEVGFNIVDAGDSTFFQAGGPLEVGDWEVALFAWAGSGQIASGKGIYETDGNQNYGGFSNAEVDAAWETLASSVDPEVHLEQVKIIEKLLWDNLYGIPLFAHPSMVGYDATLENVRDTAVQTGVSWNAEQWVRSS
ncbi:ABC transporter substrate-binding protein [Ornithinimicrobium flavum]|uniref:ABC transporter substrate-binding protein n=1 Tax=Ornithinimicrobium flavum TaxID=1288636 RepID=UPI00106F9E52|nr:ABC transporter substrate-binding protein [Ornithinimicrobium flavum]